MNDQPCCPHSCPHCGLPLGEEPFDPLKDIGDEVMTKPTPEQIQRACDLANGPNDATPWFPIHYGACSTLTALADTIAELDAEKVRADAANVRANNMRAERDKATADLGTIDEIAAMYGWGKPEADIGKKTVAAIVAPYRVETDPLVEALVAANAQLCSTEEEYAPILRAELAKRGIKV